MWSFPARYSCPLLGPGRLRGLFFSPDCPSRERSPARWDDPSGGPLLWAFPAMVTRMLRCMSQQLAQVCENSLFQGPPRNVFLGWHFMMIVGESTASLPARARRKFYSAKKRRSSHTAWAHHVGCCGAATLSLRVSYPGRCRRRRVFPWHQGLNPCSLGSTPHPCPRLG